MGENWRWEIYADFFQALSLGFIYGHSKADAYRKLPSVQCEREICIAGDNVNPRDECHFACLGAINDPHPVASSKISLVPLQRPFFSDKFRRSIKGQPFLTFNSCGGMPLMLSEFKNSAGYCIVS